jgi:hypothetical protein
MTSAVFSSRSILFVCFGRGVGFLPSKADKKYASRRKNCGRHNLLKDPRIWSIVRHLFVDFIENRQINDERLTKFADLLEGYDVRSFFFEKHTFCEKKQGENLLPFQSRQKVCFSKKKLRTS